MSGSRFLLALSGLVPLELRAEWLCEWEAELAHARASRASLPRIWATAAEDAARHLPERLEAGASVQDVRFALRSLRSNPGFTVAAIATLALGIGANTATFSVVNAFLVRPLPLPSPERVVAVLRERPDAGPSLTSAPNYTDWRARAHSFEDLSAVQLWSVNLTGWGRPRRVSRALVTPGFFAVLGVRPAIGRGFLPEEAERGHAPVAVISNGLWRDVFGADAAVVGRTVELDGVAHEIVGVMPRDFRAPPLTSDVWIPLAFTEDALLARGRNNLYTIGRLRGNVTLEAARADMSRVARELAAEYPAQNEGWGIGVRPLHELAVGSAPTALWTLFGAVALVLLIACANVANLVIARGAARSRELAVRVALGASRGRLVTQLLAESVVLSVAGGALGLLVAWLALNPMRALVPDGLASVADVTIDATVMLFTLIASVTTGIVAGLVPALRLGSSGRASASRLSTLRERGGQSRVRSGLAVAQFALATVLLVGAGLMVRSLTALGAVELGVSTNGVSAFEVTFPEATYPEPARVIAAIGGVLESLEANARVELAAAVSHLPLSGARLSSSLDIEGAPPIVGNDAPSATIRVATPGYFETLGITRLRGRVFAAADRAGTEPVAVINETAAEAFWPGEDAVGRWIAWANGPSGEQVRRRVIGVVAGTRHAGPLAELRAEVYEPYGQTTDVWRWFGRSMSFVVRTRDGRPLDVASAQDAVAPTDPDLPVVGLATLDQVLVRSVATPRFQGILAGVFGTLALVLAVIGMYGVLAFTVRSRTREMGIRMTLGAGRRRVLRDVLADGARLAVMGATVGVVTALALGRLFRSLLWGVEPSDPLTFTGVAVVLAAATLAASFAPAWRAASVDPATSLRAE